MNILHIFKKVREQEHDKKKMENEKTNRTSRNEKHLK